jgi:putative PIN family toxin of toxin-antitoxin system
VVAVLDANVLVSALISRAGAPARLVELWFAGEFELVVCRTLLDEIERTLAQPKIGSRVASEDRRRFVRLLEQLAEVVPDPEGSPPVHSVDPGDDYLLALAARERAQLVSGDAHVLALADTQPISSPRAFLDQLERA